MPNRIIRDWTDSERIDELSVQSERFFVRLIMKVDDYGRYNANVKFLKSTLFPLKTDVRETDITRWLAECEKSGLITLYTVTLKEYVQIENFKQTLRQKNEKYPGPEKKDCIASATQVHSIRHTSAFLNRIETETEVETEVEGVKNATHPPDVIEAFKNFNAWITINAPDVQKLKYQITIDQFVKLKERYPKMNVVTDMLKNMHNYKKLTTSYKDVYLTLNKWLKRDE